MRLLCIAQSLVKRVLTRMSHHSHPPPPPRLHTLSLSRKKQTLFPSLSEWYAHQLRVVVAPNGATERVHFDDKRWLRFCCRVLTHDL